MEVFSMDNIIVGLMRYSNLDEYDKFEKFINESINRNLKTFDIANIYGAGRSEILMGMFLSKYPDLRKELTIITKSGIIAATNDYVGHLNLSCEYIIQECDKSLDRLQSSYIDLYLIHRPSPFADYAQIAQAAHILLQDNKIKEFGVSNFYPEQVRALQAQLDKYNIRIKINQVEINAFNLEHFKNFNIEFSQSQNIELLAWSPLGGLYKILDNLENELYSCTYKSVEKISKKYNCTPIHILYSFIASHPSNIKIITGTTDYNKLDTAINALNIKLAMADWFEIYVATQGYPMP